MLGKPDVQEHQVERRAFTEYLERLGSVTGRFDPMSGFLEQRRQDVPKSTIVVDEENAATWGGLSHHESLTLGTRGIGEIRNPAPIPRRNANPEIPDPGSSSRSVMLACQSFERRGEVN